MSSTETARVPDADGARALQQRFAQLRRRLRVVTLTRGVGWLTAILLGVGLLAGLLDWRSNLPGLARAVVLVGMLGGAGVVLLRLLLRPLNQRTDDLSLALAVEERYPNLNDALASTVQFLENPEQAETASEPMRQEAVRRALAKAKGCDFNRVVDSRGMGPAVALGSLALLLVVALTALAPALAVTAGVRLADPFGAHAWPTATQVVFEQEPRTRIGRSEPYQLRARVLGVVPAEATVELSFEGFPTAKKTFRIGTEGDRTGSLRVHLKPEEVQRTFRFRVLANDAVTPEYQVEVLPPPVLVSRDGQPSPQLRLTYPAYTDLPSPRDLSPGTGNVEGVFGTSVLLRAAADRPLRRAWIEYAPEVREAPLALALAPLGAGSPLGVATAALGGRVTWTPIEATLEADRRQFQVAFQPRVHGGYALHFEDETGLPGVRRFDLRLQTDPPPSVRLDRPSASRDTLTLVPTATLQLEIVAEDAEYALRTVFLEYRTTPDEAPRTVGLWDAAGVGLAAIGPAAGLAARGAAAKVRPSRVEVARKLSLRSLVHASGRALQEGDVVLLQACADDFDDVTVSKEPGRSHQVEIRIVGRERLDQVVSQEETRVQQDLVRLREKEREALARVAEAEKKIRRGEKLTPDDLEKLIQAEQTQQQVRERIGDRKDGLRAEVQRVRETLEQNDMKNSAAKDRMDMVARELERLAEKELEQIEPKLTAARKAAELLDEKARAERAGALEQKAREAERDARVAEAEARKLGEQAAQQEELAEKAGDAGPDGKAEQAAREAEAKKLRDRAAAAEKKGRELREQAARDRRDAGQPADEKAPGEALADARRGQEEVEKTLAAMLQEMEPSTSTRQVKAEAGRLLDEQKALERELEELARKEKDLDGKSPDELTPQQKAELEAARDSQKRLEERTADLLNQMKRSAEQRAGKDPEAAREMKEAAEQAEAGNLTGKMKQAADRVRDNKLNEARKAQQEALAELQKLAKNLEDRREAELDRLIKKLKQAEEQVAELMKEQEQLKKKADEARKLEDEDKREEALKKLARQQKALQEKTQEVVKELSRLRGARAGQALGQAAEEMEGAQRDLTRGKDDEKQEDALDRLDEAKEELERARKRAEEELGREQLARVADTIKRLRERQEAHGREAARVQTAAQENGNWTRALKSSLRNLGENQKALGAETVAVARKEVAGVPVFARLLERAADAMTRAGDRAGALVQDAPDVKALPDVELTEAQALALRRLSQLLEAVKESQEQPRPLNGAGGGGGGGDGEGGGGGGGGGDDSLPPPAQLKLLRGMQKEINERTEQFRARHPEPEKFGPKEKAELDAIQKEQKEVADLLERLLRPEEKNLGGDGR